MQFDQPKNDPGIDFHCITCSDEALPATVLSVNQAAGLALVQLENEQVEVDISLVDQPALGDRLLIHGGVGLANLGNDNQGG